MATGTITPATAEMADVGAYARYDGERLVSADGEDTAGEVPALAEFIHDSFRALVLNPRFSCVGAKSAFQRDNYRFAAYDAELGSDAAADALAGHLERFVREQDDELRGRGLSTFVVGFTGPVLTDEKEFERLLWATLQKLHDRDALRHGWDASVSSDPDDPRFEWSFAGRAFFVVGLHPAASRWARRFAFPTLVFNAQFQFEELRATGKYGRMQEAIRGRDVALQGDLNPNLADFGAHSDARQYSGRAVEVDWRCPFHAHPAATVQASHPELDAEELDAEGRLR
jgi:hypothetical protein